MKEMEMPALGKYIRGITSNAIWICSCRKITKHNKDKSWKL